MKRKIAALLMGTTLSVAVCGYSVQAMTYGYDMGGKVFISEDSSSSNLTEEEKEKRKCRVNGEETTALIFSRKHLAVLYLQCLMYRKELALQKGSLEDMSEICNRIYQLENVDVLCQCMMMDMARWEEDKLYIQFSTVFLLEK